VKAIDDERMLVAFGIAPGSKVSLTLDHGADVEDGAADFPRSNHHFIGDGSGCPIGLCQTQP
jgi:hypothetical protein